jgi:hypothetical protein
MIHCRDVSQTVFERLTMTEPEDETSGAETASLVPTPARRQATQLRQIIQIATYRKRQILERMLMD